MRRIPQHMPDPVFFTDDALKFLRQLKRNNNREWFQARKAIYEEQLKAPMERLVEAINARMVKFAPDYLTEPKKAVFRIYRDTRFSNDKTPYKTNVAAWFRRSGVKDTSAGGFYFHLSTEELMVAAGVYMPPPDQTLAIRKHLLEHHVRFRELAAKPSKKMMALEGAALTRDPKGFPKAHPAMDLIRQKQWGWYARHEPDIALTPKLLKSITDGFAILAPLVDFLNEPFVIAKPRREIFFE
jgi:uncharacterized protein (TIGR02453 family)